MVMLHHLRGVPKPATVSLKRKIFEMQLINLVKAAEEEHLMMELVEALEQKMLEVEVVVEQKTLEVVVVVEPKLLEEVAVEM